MAIEGIAAGASDAKLSAAKSQAQVSVLKKQLDQSGDVALKVLDSAAPTDKPLTKPGIGEKLNLQA